MSEYNIQMNKYNALNAQYDQLYPQPMKHASTHAKDGDDPITPSSIGAAELGADGKVLASQIPSIEVDAYTKVQTLSDTTKALFGLDANAVPDDVFAMLLCPQIIVTSLTGATVTCTKGDTVLTAEEFDGKLTFFIPEYGTWIVSETFNSTTYTLPVVVDTVKQYIISRWLYIDGKEPLGEWAVTRLSSFDSGWGDGFDFVNLSKTEKSMVITQNSAGSYREAAVALSNKVDLTEVSKIRANCAHTSWNQYHRFMLVVCKNAITLPGNSFVTIQSSASQENVELDVSSLSGDYNVYFVTGCDSSMSGKATVEVLRVWME